MNLLANFKFYCLPTVVAPQPFKNMEASEESIRMTSDPQSKTFLQSPDTHIHLEKSPSAKPGKYSLLTEEEKKSPMFLVFDVKVCACSQTLLKQIWHMAK